EEERASIAREIHDELGQACTAIKMDLALIGRKITRRQAQLRAKIESSMRLVDDMIVTLRRIASDLRPRTLDDLGLAAALVVPRGVLLGFRRDARAAQGEPPEEGVVGVPPALLLNAQLQPPADEIGEVLQLAGVLLDEVSGRQQPLRIGEDQLPGESAE